MSSRVLVAIVVFNEEASLARTIADLREHCTYDLVMIDNGSTDGSVALCRSLGVPYVAHCTNTGSGMGTVRTYFQYAYQRGYDVVCQFDGDGQHMASHLPAIVDPVIEGRADYVIGSRFIEKQGFQSSSVRRIGINLFSAIASRIVGHPITDVTSGFRAYGRLVIELFARHYHHEMYDTSQLLLLAHYAGARILEVPVEMRARVAGVSEYTPLRASVYPFISTLNVVGCLLQRKALERARQV